MYSKNQISEIFKNVKNWDELEKVCNAFAFLVEQDAFYTFNFIIRCFIAEQAQFAFRRIEKLEL
jgi:hypothetical protein